ncbi:MAG: copper-binding protein [Sterolibacterium sp.]|nr:copper-binding protein [Sterolibacterium sp.]
MKTVFITAFITLAATFPAPGIAADDHAGHGALYAAAPAVADMADGLVKKVDKPAGKVTIAHGQLVNLGMPAMTMAFRVKNTAWLDQMKDGDKIRFMADKVDGAYTVVHFERTK